MGEISAVDTSDPPELCAATIEPPGETTVSPAVTPTQPIVSGSGRPGETATVVRSPAWARPGPASAAPAA